MEACQIKVEAGLNIKSASAFYIEILFETGISISEYEEIKSVSTNRNLTGHKLHYAIAAKGQNYTLEGIGARIGIKAVGT